MATGAELIAAERDRQMDSEGWSSEHDDAHVNDEIAMAASCYALPNRHRRLIADVPAGWPWSTDFWKPSTDDRVRELVKAGALIAAEIDRLQRPAATSHVIKRQAQKIEILRTAIGKVVSKTAVHWRDDHQCDLCDALEQTRS